MSSKTVKSVVAVFCSVTAFALSAVTGTMTAEGLTVTNNHYSVFFDKAKGFVPTSYTINGRKQGGHGGPYAMFDGEPEVYQKRYPAAPRVVTARLMKTQAELKENTGVKVVLHLNRTFEGGTISEKITFDNTEKVLFEMEFSYSQRPFLLEYRMDFYGISGTDKYAHFYPGKRRDVGINEDFPFHHAPCWNYFFNSNMKFGVGMLVPEDRGDTAAIVANTRGREEGWHHSTHQKVTTDQLRYNKFPGKSSMKFYVLLGKTEPEKMEETAKALLPPLPEFDVENLWIEKIAVKTQGENKVTAKLVNRTNAPRTVKISAVCEYGLMKSFVISPEETVTVPANSTIDYGKSWKFPKEALFGATVKVICKDNGKEIVKEDFCGAHDEMYRIGALGICTPDFCNQVGSEAAWMNALKRNYYGLMEYYTWAPSTVGGLAPDFDSWYPHTEQEGSTGTAVKLEKKFVKEFIKQAHKNGLMVYAWITGLVNHNYGLNHPEHVQYCENGQPSVYNSKIIRGDRFSTFKINAFTKEFAAKWGNEMADSVDMFGWDGCRWDWSFIPDQGNDPMLHGGTDTDWYDYRGIPAKSLFPDPDKTAAECTKAWIDAVQKRHPNFQFGTNYSVRQAMADKYKNLHKQMSRNGLLLHEFLIPVYREDLGTFQKYAKELFDAHARTRQYRSMPTVGQILGPARGSYSLRMIHYLCGASGVRFWGYNRFDVIEKEYEINRYFVRFCEFYFNPDFVPIPDQRRKTEVKVDGHKRIFSDFFAYERASKNKRDVTVHLINLPENGDYICQRQVPAPVRKNTVVTVQPRKGETLKKVYAAMPKVGEKQLPGMVELSVSGNSATLPELKEAAVLIFEFEVK